MSQILVQNLTFHYETSEDNILDHASFQIDTDWKLGFIGRNGRGKTTFLKLLMGQYSYEGHIETSVCFDYFPFEVTDSQRGTREVLRELIAPFGKWETEMEACLAREDMRAMERYGELLAQYEAAGGFTVDQSVEAEAGRLGVCADALDRPWSTLSGGEQVKLKLAALFLKPNHFLLIDEPTNHLDLDGRARVGAYLRRKKGFILVSHDRSLLDQAVDHVLSINRYTIEVQQGNYSSWLLNRTRLEGSERAEQEKLGKEVARLAEAKRRSEDWSQKAEQTKTGTRNSGLHPDRGYIGHQAAKLMKRAKSLESRQERALGEKTALLRDVETKEPLVFHPLAPSKAVLAQAAGLTVTCGERTIFREISFTLRQGERMLVAGPNGCGKTTLLRLLAGTLRSDGGQLYRTGGLRISVVPQDSAGLSGTLRDYARMRGVNETLFRTILRKLDFSRIQLEKNLSTYSEGQKKKVLLAASLAEPAHLYLWDEPLNFIDVLSREQLEAAICLSRPTMVFVEHDAWFCERIATKRLLLSSER